MVLLEVFIILFLLIVGGLVLIMYNAMITVRNNVNKAWANIDVILQKRYDLISRLVETVKGYRDYEKTVLLQVTELRTSWNNVKDGDNLQNKMDASNQISGTLKTLFADVENYPDLKADQNFLQLQNELVEIEDQIADSREFYNDSVNIYNIKISVVPNNLLAEKLGFKALQYFKAPEEDKNVINVDMDG